MERGRMIGRQGFTRAYRALILALRSPAPSIASGCGRRYRTTLRRTAIPMMLVVLAAGCSESTLPWPLDLALPLPDVAVHDDQGMSAQCNSDVECISGFCLHNRCSRPIGLSMVADVPLLDHGALAIVAADFDGDTLDDIAVSTNTSHVDVLVSKGMAEFAAPVTYAIPGQSQFMRPAGVNLDGRPDLVLLGQSAIWTLLEGGGGKLIGPIETSNPSDQGPASLVVGSFDHDGSPEALVTLGGPSGDVRMWDGQSNGVFSPAARPSGLNFVAFDGASGDLDGDGLRDVGFLYLAREDVEILLARGNGDGTFAPVASPQVHAAPLPTSAFSIRFADFDRDGRLDIAVLASTALYVFAGRPGLEFAPAVSVPLRGIPLGLEVADMNVDGYPDLVVPVRNGGLDIYAHTGNGVGFRLAGTWPWSLENAVIIAIGDLNGDARPDVVGSAFPNGDHLAVLMNTSQ